MTEEIPQLLGVQAQQGTRIAETALSGGQHDVGLALSPKHQSIPDLAVWAVEVTERREEEMSTEDKAAAFALNIELGNDAMQDPYDVAVALRKLADQMRADAYPETGIIRDANGNTVGRYTFS